MATPDSPAPRLIVALDSADAAAALALAARLDPRRCAVKVGKELFVAAGPQVVREIVARGFNVFLDLKFHDIPSTVEHSARQAVRYGVSMFTIHALGGLDMMKAAEEAVADEAEKHRRKKPLVLAVTVLTSHDDESLKGIGINSPARDQVLRLAALADKAGVGGLVCSGMEVEMLRKEFGDRFTLVTPGIRPGTASHDQKRVTTPAAAVAAGADYLVIGRAITEADNPIEVLDSIVTSIS